MGTYFVSSESSKAKGKIGCQPMVSREKFVEVKKLLKWDNVIGSFAVVEELESQLFHQSYHCDKAEF